MSVRKFYDAIDANKLPAGGDGYLGYDDGNWPDEPTIEAKFPGKIVISITVNPNDNKGIIGDGPPDNGTWQQWVGWVQKRRASGEDPWINTNMSNWPAGKLAFSLAKVAEPHWWIAKYDNDPTIPAGALMKQYASNDSYDTSSAAAYLPGIDPKPAATPTTPTVQEEDDVAKFEKTCNPETGRAGIGFAAGDCGTFQVTCDKGAIPPAPHNTWRFVIVLDSGPDVVEQTVEAPNGKAVVHVPPQFAKDVSGIITYGPVGLEYELYAQ
jgi:hypothetical protein